MQDLKRVRVVLADDHELVLEAFKSLLASRVDVVGVAADGHELIQVTRDTLPDIVVADIAMPGLNGVDACAKLTKILPDLKIIFLTVSDEPDKVAHAMRSGASGYLLKRSAAKELFDAIEAVAAGKSYITSDVAESASEALVSHNTVTPLERLTPRQREVLQLLAEGHSMKAIASILHVTPRTIAFHKYRLMDALSVTNNAHLVLFAKKAGLLN